MLKLKKFEITSAFRLTDNFKAKLKDSTLEYVDTVLSLLYPVHLY